MKPAPIAVLAMNRVKYLECAELTVVIGYIFGPLISVFPCLPVLKPGRAGLFVKRDRHYHPSLFVFRRREGAVCAVAPPKNKRKTPGLYSISRPRLMALSGPQAGPERLTTSKAGAC